MFLSFFFSLEKNKNKKNVGYQNGKKNKSANLTTLGPKT